MKATVSADHLLPAKPESARYVLSFRCEACQYLCRGCRNVTPEPLPSCKQAHKNVVMINLQENANCKLGSETRGECTAADLSGSTLQFQLLVRRSFLALIACRYIRFQTLTSQLSTLCSSPHIEGRDPCRLGGADQALDCLSRDCSGDSSRKSLLAIEGVTDRSTSR